MVPTLLLLEYKTNTGIVTLADLIIVMHVSIKVQLIVYYLLFCRKDRRKIHRSA